MHNHIPRSKPTSHLSSISTKRQFAAAIPPVVMQERFCRGPEGLAV